MEWKVERPTKKNEKIWPHKCVWRWRKGGGSRKVLLWSCLQKLEQVSQEPHPLSKGSWDRKEPMFLSSQVTLNPVSFWVRGWDRVKRTPPHTHTPPSAAGMGLTLTLLPDAAGQSNQSVADAMGPRSSRRSYQRMKVSSDWVV